MADYKAVSMNLMHDSIEITNNTYIPILSSYVQDRLTGLSGKAMSTPGDELEVFLSTNDRENQKTTLMFIL
jgi:hypothetical protein